MSSGGPKLSRDFMRVRLLEDFTQAKMLTQIDWFRSIMIHGNFMNFLRWFTLNPKRRKEEPFLQEGENNLKIDYHYFMDSWDPSGVWWTFAQLTAIVENDSLFVDSSSFNDNSFMSTSSLWQLQKEFPWMRESLSVSVSAWKNAFIVLDAFFLFASVHWLLEDTFQTWWQASLDREIA